MHDFGEKMDLSAGLTGEKSFENVHDGRSANGRTDDGRTTDACIYYTLTYQPSAQVSLKLYKNIS